MAEAQVAALIGEIYDAALDPARWPRVLEHTSVFINGGPAMLFSQDPVRRVGELHCAWKVADNFRALYFEDILKTNPLLPLTTFVPIGQPFAISTLMPYAELKVSRFFTEYMQPQGMIDIVGVVLEKSAAGQVIAGFGRDAVQGLGDAEANHRMGLIAPHLRRAVSIGKLIDRQHVEAEILANVLDSLAAGVFLVGAAGEVIRANARGRAMAQEQSVLGMEQNRLAIRDRRIGRVLQETLQRVAAERLEAGGGNVELTGTMNERYVASVLPLTSGYRRRAYGDHGAVAAVFVREAGVEAAPSLELVARSFGLTPAEVRVLHALILEAKGVAAIAAVTGIAESTVKTHLRHLFRKTGTSRQLQLVKLVASYASPVGSERAAPSRRTHLIRTEDA
jgi:DNA-binding CsgD family transcriptional regulator